MSTTGTAAWMEPWLATVEDRIAWLRATSAASGGPSVEELDLSGPSLRVLWAWARHRFNRRPGGAEPGVLPLWYGDPRAWTPKWWDDDSIWLADAVVAYFAETLRRAAPTVSWTVGHDADDPERYVYEGQPVLVGLGGADVHPWTLVANTVGRVWAGTAGDEDLYRLWEVHAGGHVR